MEKIIIEGYIVGWTRKGRSPNRWADQLKNSFFATNLIKVYIAQDRDIASTVERDGEYVECKISSKNLKQFLFAVWSKMADFIVYIKMQQKYVIKLYWIYTLFLSNNFNSVVLKETVISTPGPRARDARLLVNLVVVQFVNIGLIRVS